MAAFYAKIQAVFVQPEAIAKNITLPRLGNFHSFQRRTKAPISRIREGPRTKHDIVVNTFINK